MQEHFSEDFEISACLKMSADIRSSGGCLAGYADRAGKAARSHQGRFGAPMAMYIAPESVPWTNALQSLKTALGNLTIIRGNHKGESLETLALVMCWRKGSAAVWFLLIIA